MGNKGLRHEILLNYLELGMLGCGELLVITVHL